MQMPDHRDIGERFAAAMNRLDRPAMLAVVTEDLVTDWPQSGERIVGFANFYAMLTNYPRRDGVPPSNDHQNVGSNPSAALKLVAPTYTLVAVEGAGNSGTFTVRVTYPDGSIWWAVNLYQLRNGKIAYTKSFFAPEYPAPEWRAKWVVSIPASGDRASKKQD